MFKAGFDSFEAISDIASGRCGLDVNTISWWRGNWWRSNPPAVPYASVRNRDS